MTPYYASSEELWILDVAEISYGIKSNSYDELNLHLYRFTLAIIVVRILRFLILKMNSWQNKTELSIELDRSYLSVGIRCKAFCEYDYECRWNINGRRTL